MTSNYEYSSYSSSSGGAGGADIAGGLFAQADTNRDGVVDRGEFSNFIGGAVGGVGGYGVGVGGAGGYGVGAGGAGGSYESSSYESYSTGGGAGLVGVGGVSSVDAGAVDAAALGGGSYQTSYSSAAGAGAGAGYDTALLNQAASYTSESNAAWSRYGAEVRGAGLYVDANPQIIRRAAPGGVQTYTQNIRVRFLQPPPVPPPGPIIIKEVRPPQPPVPPPLRIRQQAPPLPTPPPLVLRERPPVPPAPIPSETRIRNLPPVPVPPRSVIIERLPAAPPRPRDIIIERWIQYGAQAKRETKVIRAGAAHVYAAPRNIIIQYEQPQVRIVRQFQRLGVTAENPQSYVARYGAQLLDAASLVAQARAAGVVEDITPPALAASSVAASSSSFSAEGAFGVDAVGGAGLVGGAGFVGGDLGGVSSSYSSSSYEGVGGAGGLVAGGYEGGVVGGGYDAGLVGGVGGASYESSSYSSSGGYGGVGVGGGFDLAQAAFNSADSNKDGTLSASEFNRFVQGGL